MGKNLDDFETFQAALKLLSEELKPDEDLLNPDNEYLETVAQGLFYKVLILQAYTE